MTSPHPPRSYYSISSDYSPTQSFDEDGDSFTSFGSIQTPPRLRAMICSIFDGTLNSPIRSFPDSDYGDADSYHERVTDPGAIPAAIVEEGMNEGETFGDHRARLLASIPPLAFDRAPIAYSSDQDGEYELDDSVVAPTPHTDQEHYTVVVGSPAPASLGYVPDATNEVGQDVGLLDPKDNGVFPVDPRLQLPSEDDDRSTIDSVFSLLNPYEDPTDTTYVPPRKSGKSQHGRARFSGALSPKPKPVFIRPRDSKGRFVSLQSKKFGKLKATSVDEQPPQSPLSSTFLHQAAVDSGHSHQAETTRNTFLNTVLTSPEEAFPFTFHLPDPHLNAIPKFPSSKIQAHPQPFADKSKPRSP
ncbi:hypothetical protein PGTUg99_030232 [Puccinia graminis f. sp. tritici]|uniref:Uncharacterized protein n=1 Tax=Puccinia graminis f. sp. tritici TaxID=56615 RepID=A0A5B0RID4_PUCGR|nr:hypothetical protein PGTUg99_030232 [Puccinia graminis f. sp. tritici]